MPTSIRRLKQVLDVAAISQEGRTLLENAMDRVRNEQYKFFVFPSSHHPVVQSLKEGGLDVVVLSGPDWAAIASPVPMEFTPGTRDFEKIPAAVLMVFPDEQSMELFPDQESMEEESMQRVQYLRPDVMGLVEHGLNGDEMIRIPF